MGYELNVLKDCRELFKLIRIFTKEQEEYRFTLNPQIIRAAISVGSNVAEGSRRSKKEFDRFLNIAIGSCEEVKYQISLYESEKSINITNLCDKILGQLINLKKSITRNPEP